MHRIAVVAITATLAAAGLVVAVVARDDGPTGERSGIFGPGTDIGDGFRVVEGSALLGTRFPLDRSFDRRMPSTWVAVLLVEGDPLEVLAGYADQAAEAGLPMFESNSELCSPSGDLIECVLRGETGPYNASAGRSITATLSRTRPGADAPFAGHLVLRYETWGDPSQLPPATSAEGAPRLVSQVRFGPSPRLPDLPGPGEPIAPHLQPSWDRRLIEVEPGSELLAPPVPLHCDAQPGFEAVLRVADHPETVVDRYANQFRSAFGSGLEQPRRHLEQDGLDATQLSFVDSGFGNADAVAVTVSSGASYVWIERCGD